jgi:N-acetylglucosamine-6-phosphate deacetylase
MTIPAGATSGPALVLQAAIITPDRVLDRGWLLIDGPCISALGSGPPPAGARVLDLGRRMVAPGYLDLHVHGGAGVQVNGTSVAEVADSVTAMARFHATHGTTALVATTVSDARDTLLTTVRGISRAMTKADHHAATVLGAHLEGPWLAPSRAGAQNPQHLREPSISELHDLLDAAMGALLLITIAPERPAALAVIRAAAAAGVVMSVGHTEADFDTTRAAFDAGARHATHLFNAMPDLLHRRPGPVAAALADPRVTVELIADGIHVHPAVLALAVTAAPGRAVAVTDAISATGLGDGLYRLGELEVKLVGRRVALAAAAGTLAGSVLTMDVAVATLAAAGVPLSVAVRAATATPASVIGATTKGRLVPGADADMVILEPDLSVAATIIGGQVVHDPHRLLRPTALIETAGRP